MNPLSVEDFEEDVVLRLQSALPAALAQISATYLAKDRAQGLANPDGTSLVAEKLVAPERTSGPPNGFGDYYPGGTDVASAWPSIEVAVPDLAVDAFDLAQQDADVALNLVVRVWLKHGSFPVLNKMQKRYAAAVVYCLQPKGAMGDCSISNVRMSWRTNPELRDENERLQTSGLIFFELDTGLSRS